MDYRPRRVCEVEDGWFESGTTENRDRLFVALDLETRKLVLARVVGSGKMCHYAFKMKVGKLAQFRRECLQLVKTDAETSHSGVNLDVDAGRDTSLACQPV